MNRAIHWSGAVHIHQPTHHTLKHMPTYAVVAPNDSNAAAANLNDAMVSQLVYR
jgi:hypothetical protein